MQFDLLFKTASGEPLETVSSLRNGDVTTRGLTVRDFRDDEIILGAINSRGNRASGGVYIRLECLPELVENLILMSAELRPQDKADMALRIQAALSAIEVKEADTDALNLTF